MEKFETRVTKLENTNFELLQLMRSMSNQIDTIQISLTDKIDNVQANVNERFFQMDKKVDTFQVSMDRKIDTAQTTLDRKIGNVQVNMNEQFRSQCSKASLTIIFRRAKVAVIPIDVTVRLRKTYAACSLGNLS